MKFIVVIRAGSSSLEAAHLLSRGTLVYVIERELGLGWHTHTVILDTLAQRTRVYTERDDGSIVEYLVRALEIAGRSVTGAAARAQDELWRYQRLAEQISARLEHGPQVAFSWIRG